MTMNEENSFRKDGYPEDDLFSNGTSQPSYSGMNSPKPLFPEAEIPPVKPLFEKSSGPAAVPVPQEGTTISSQPPSPQVTEAFIESKLKEAGPTAFVSTSAGAEPPQELLSKPDEAPASYLPRPEAPEIRDPIIVQGNAAQEKEESAIDIPAGPPAQENAMTAQPPEDSRTSFTETKPEGKQTEPKTAEENGKLKTARPLPSSGPRYGKIRTREAIIPPDLDRNRIAITADPATSSIGALMQNARKQAGMSLEQAAAATRIKKNYIEALETDDFKSLPSGIFPSAYVRTLCGVYNLNEESRNIALRKIRESAGAHEDVPEQLIQHLEQDVQKNEEEEKRINKIFYCVVSAAATVLVLIIAGIILLTISLRQPRTPAVPEQQGTAAAAEIRTPPVNSFDAGQLESLTPPQIPSIMRELVIPSR